MRHSDRELERVERDDPAFSGRCPATRNVTRHAISSDRRVAEFVPPLVCVEVELVLPTRKTHVSTLPSTMSASAVFSGNVTTKKKAELQEIAQALGIPDVGMREEIQQRVKKHLEDNATDLQDDPAFTGLYTRNIAPEIPSTAVFICECPLAETFKHARVVGSDSRTRHHTR